MSPKLTQALDIGSAHSSSLSVKDQLPKPLRSHARHAQNPTLFQPFFSSACRMALMRFLHAWGATVMALRASSTRQSE